MQRSMHNVDAFLDKYSVVDTFQGEVHYYNYTIQ